VGGTRTVRALRCGCGRHLEGGDDEELFGRVLAHLRDAHPALAFAEEQIVALVAHAFELESAAPHEGAKEPDEGLGTEPR
jgi:predicted small metal-binding protein